MFFGNSINVGTKPWGMGGMSSQYRIGEWKGAATVLFFFLKSCVYFLTPARFNVYRFVAVTCFSAIVFVPCFC